MVSRACLQSVMRGTHRGTNLLSLSRMTWEPIKRPARDPALHTLSHTSKTGNLRRAAHSLTELPLETHSLPGSIEISQFFPLWYQNSESGQRHARDPTRNKPAEPLMHDLGT